MSKKLTQLFSEGKKLRKKSRAGTTNIAKLKRYGSSANANRSKKLKLYFYLPIFFSRTLGGVKRLLHIWGKTPPVGRCTFSQEMANSNIQSKASRNGNNSCVPPRGSNHFQSKDFNGVRTSHRRRIKKSKFTFLKFHVVVFNSLCVDYLRR